MKNQLKLAIGSVLAVATLILITAGGAVAEDKGNRNSCNCSCNGNQQRNTSPSSGNSLSQPYPAGYTRGK